MRQSQMTTRKPAAAKAVQASFSLILLVAVAVFGVQLFKLMVFLIALVGLHAEGFPLSAFAGIVLRAATGS